MPQNGEIAVRLSSTLTGSVDSGSVQAVLDKLFSISLTEGTGLGQANNVWWDERTLATGTNEDLDFSGGVTNALGVALLGTKIKAIFFHGLNTNTGLVSVTRPATNGVPIFKAAGDGIDLHPNGIILVGNPTAAGYAIVAATGDLINIANDTGASQKYFVAVWLAV
jgi:hypothetical protein